MLRFQPTKVQAVFIIVNITDNIRPLNIHGLIGLLVPYIFVSCSICVAVLCSLFSNLLKNKNKNQLSVIANFITSAIIITPRPCMQHTLVHCRDRD